MKHPFAKTRGFSASYNHHFYCPAWPLRQPIQSSDEEIQPSVGLVRPSGRLAQCFVRLDVSLVGLDQSSVRLYGLLDGLDQSFVRLDETSVSFDEHYVRLDRSSVSIDQRFVRLDESLVGLDLPSVGLVPSSGETKKPCFYPNF